MVYEVEVLVEHWLLLMLLFGSDVVSNREMVLRILERHGRRKVKDTEVGFVKVEEVTACMSGQDGKLMGKGFLGKGSGRGGGVCEESVFEVYRG